MSDGDPWPAEPDEPENPGQKYLDRFDPESESPEPDPESDLAPDIQVPDDADVPEGLFRAFWSLVATINLGLFAASLGLMLVVFRGQLREGGAVFLLGAAALAYAGYRYREVRNGDFDGDGDTESRPSADD